MLKIRLTRGGTKKRPYYSIVVADSHSREPVKPEDVPALVEELRAGA